MADESGRTLVCSVLFLDLIGYSKKAVTDQHETKHQFNSALTEALELLQRRDRVIVDTGDGAAIVFLGDPEDAMIVGLAMRESSARVPMRLGINLGPVRLISDLNDQTNVIGDGINVAQRIMSFAEPGQLLVSHSYFEVVTRVSEHYKRLFVRVGMLQDKHVRDHDIYLVDDDIRLNEDPLAPRPEPAAPRGPAKVVDTGTALMISGSRIAVEVAMRDLVAKGAAALSVPSQVGAKWYASCSHPGQQNVECKVENVGLKRVITGPSRQAVAAKVADLVSFGAKLVGEIEEIDGRWTAVCDTQR
jgi:adenylate/guanylate cyclase family protein